MCVGSGINGGANGTNSRSSFSRPASGGFTGNVRPIIRNARLALATHWLASDRFVGNIEHWCTTSLADEKLAESLLEILQIRQDDFWLGHCDPRLAPFEEAPAVAGRRPRRGSCRQCHSALALDARGGSGTRQLQETIEHRFNVWPAAGDNSILRLARQRLLNGAPRRVLRTGSGTTRIDSNRARFLRPFQCRVR